MRLQRMENNMPLGLLALAVGSFGVGLTEFVIMGLLREVAHDFRITEAVAGWFISGYALSVGIGGIAVTAGVTRIHRKPVLLGLMVLSIVGNLLSAVATTFTVMMIGRVVAALCQGTFFGIGSVVAMNLAAPEKRSGAIAIMFAGLTMATIIGVPLGTVLGQHFGWRSAFWAMTLVGVIALIGLALFIPNLDATKSETEPTSLRDELRAFTHLQVWLSIAVTILGFGGMFGAFTYIAYILTQISGFTSQVVPWMLALFGAGTFVGNILGGKAADKSVSKTLTVTLLGLAGVLGIFALTAHSQIMTGISLFLMGAFAFAAAPGLQTRIMRSSSQAPTMASTANIAAFNIGNALGAWLGGLTISVGLGYTSPIWAGAGLTLTGFAVLLMAQHLAARQGDSPA